MLFPVRCYTCNEVLAHKHTEFLKRTGSVKERMDALGVQRMCCRRMFLAHVDLIADQIAYPNMDIVLDASGTCLKRLSADTHTVSCD